MSYEINVFDAVGKLLKAEKNSQQIDLSAYENGIYFMQISDGIHNTFTKKVSLIK